jgi:hypothetical protein
MTTENTAQPRDLPIRHALATLSYRAAKVLRGAPEEFSAFRPGSGSRSAGEILAHVCDLLDWALSQVKGGERWRNSTPRGWAEDTGRFFAALGTLDDYLGSGQTLHVPAETLFQGAVADALTHVGQIAMLRRMAGAPIRGENYAVAKIASGQIGPDQPPPVYEFG